MVPVEVCDKRPQNPILTMMPVYWEFYGGLKVSGSGLTVYGVSSTVCGADALEKCSFSKACRLERS